MLEFHILGRDSSRWCPLFSASFLPFLKGREVPFSSFLLVFHLVQIKWDGIVEVDGSMARCKSGAIEERQRGRLRMGKGHLWCFMQVGRVWSVGALEVLFKHHLHAWS